MILAPLVMVKLFIVRILFLSDMMECFVVIQSPADNYFDFTLGRYTGSLEDGTVFEKLGFGGEPFEFIIDEGD